MIVIGAGAAGLAAARRIAAAGRSVVLLEARGRAGGRIYTRHDPRSPLPLELGAEFVHGPAPETLALLRELGIITVDAATDRWRRRDGRFTRDDLADTLAPVMERLERIEREEGDCSFEAFLARHAADLPEEARRIARLFIEGFDAADASRISARSVAAEWAGMGNVEEQPQHRLLHGYGDLVRAMIEEVRAAGGVLRLETRVRRLRWERGRVEAACESPAGDEVHVARAAVVTLPAPLLRLPEGDPGAVAFEPDLPDKRRAAGDIGNGRVVKAIFRFKQAFWEDDAWAKRAADGSLRGAAYLHDPDGAWPTWWTQLPLRVPMLTAWAGGAPARQLSGHGEEHLIETALSALATALHTPRKDLDGQVEAAWACDWSADPFARGAYSYVTVGKRDARERLAAPVDATLFFAGEATHTSGQPATVPGALASGDRAAGQVLAVLRR